MSIGPIVFNNFNLVVVSVVLEGQVKQNENDQNCTTLQTKIFTSGLRHLDSTVNAQYTAFSFDRYSYAE